MLTLLPIDETVLPYPIRREFRRGARPIVSAGRGRDAARVVPQVRKRCTPGEIVYCNVDGTLKPFQCPSDGWYDC
jgi:hypothetical protein